MLIEAKIGEVTVMIYVSISVAAAVPLSNDPIVIVTCLVNYKAAALHYGSKERDLLNLIWQILLVWTSYVWSISE